MPKSCGGRGRFASVHRGPTICLLMSQTAEDIEPSGEAGAIAADRVLTDPAAQSVWRSVLLLALPVMAEQILHMIVGLTDVYLANHLGGDPAAPTAAIGTIGYILWFIGLLTGAIGTGSTAIIARATGARHRGLANRVAGQSVMGAILVGFTVGLSIFALAEPISFLTGLAPEAREYAVLYLRVLALAMPFSMTMFVANACLRGAGDTVRPALVMLLVDGVNVLVSFALARGWGPLPEMGFTGIAIGTAVAYVIGGLTVFALLRSGRSGIRLVPGRLWPHWHTVRRILRIGVPSGIEGLLIWTANFAIVIVINTADVSSVAAAAHINAIRIESMSFLSGFAFATAAATLVGQNLGRGDPRRAARCAVAAYLIGGAIMTTMGLVFILFPHASARIIADDPRIADLTARCLFTAGWAQSGFAASMIFSGALRGAGDTVATMLLNLLSILGLRLVGVLIVGWWLKMGLVAIWVVLAAELMVRGVLVVARFIHGGWKRAVV